VRDVNDANAWTAAEKDTLHRACIVIREPEISSKSDEGTRMGELHTLLEL
jgi:hypothetical protein